MQQKNDIHFFSCQQQPQLDVSGKAMKKAINSRNNEWLVVIHQIRQEIIINDYLWLRKNVEEGSTLEDGRKQDAVGKERKTHMRNIYNDLFMQHLLR